MKETTANIIQWGADRKITTNGKYETQWLKLVSEYGELCDNIAKGKDIRDDIGDMYVVVVMMGRIAGLTIEDFSRAIDISSRATHSPGGTPLIGILHNEIGGLRYKGRMSVSSVSDIMLVLGAIALGAETTLDECVDIAYNDIKDRKGHLNDHGVFIKE